MSAETDCFSIGSIVACSTCYNQNIEGEVLAFDLQTKILILKCPSATSTKLNDVYFVNLSLCKDINVKKDVTVSPSEPQSINTHKLSTRVRNQVEQKKRLVTALKADVSPEAQNLFMTISKTLSAQDEVFWSGPNIVVFKTVTIKPPYKTENVFGVAESRDFIYVKKLVEKFGQNFEFQEISNPVAN